MRYYSSTAGQMALVSGVGAGDTLLLLDTTAGLPTSYPFTLILDYGTANEEIVDVVDVAGNSATVERGKDGTIAQSHALGAAVRHGMTGRDLRESRQHEQAVTAHGVSTVAGLIEVQNFERKTFYPSSNEPALRVRTRTANTVGAMEVRDEANTIVARLLETGLEFLTSAGSVAARLRWGGSSSSARSIMDLQIATDVHGIVGTIVSGTTARFLRLMNGATELFSVAADGVVRAAGGIFTGNVSTTGTLTANDISVAGTGWVNVNLNAGFTGSTLQVRRIGSVVYWRGEVVRDAGAFPATVTVIGTLPSSSFRPVAYVRVPLAGFGSATANGLFVNLAASTNDIEIQGVGASHDTARLGHVTYLAN